MKKFLTIAFLITLLLTPCLAQAQIADEVKQTVMKNMETTQAEDTEGMMSTIHTQSPFYMMTKQQMQPMFENYDLKYEIISYDFVGKTGDYALARVIFKTSKIAGPAFKDNQIDVIQVFKQEAGVWKLWSQASLDIQFLN